MGITASGLAFLFGALFHQDWKSTVAYISAGLMVWTFITTTLLDGCTAILGQSGIIRNVKLPFMVHILRVLLRNIIILLHSVPVVVLFLFIAHVQLSLPMLLVIPGLVIVCVWLLGASYGIAVLAARFRDIPQLVTYLLQFAMFITPVFWRVEQMGGHRAHIVTLNPLAHMVIVVRDPLLGVAPPMISWEIAISTTLVTLVLATGIVAACRKRIALWI
jgi:ABC-type polysaccharide/polyol phosphate export permease